MWRGRRWSSTVILGSFAVPSLSAYHDLFAICGAASLLAALVEMLVPRHPTHGELGHAAADSGVRRAPVASRD
jgi:hypothetical protein